MATSDFWQVKTETEHNDSAQRFLDAHEVQKDRVELLRKAEKKLLDRLSEDDVTDAEKEIIIKLLRALDLRNEMTRLQELNQAAFEVYTSLEVSSRVKPGTTEPTSTVGLRAL